MRQLDDFKYLAEFINKTIDTKLQDMRSQFVKVKKTDGVFCDCELVKNQKDVSEFKNIPIIQSGRFHYSTKEGDLGLLLNTGQIPAELFTTGTLKGAIVDLPFYLFLPIQTKVDGLKNQLKKDNVIIEDSEKTNTLKLDQQGIDLKTGKELKVTTGGNITIDGGSNTTSITSSGGITLEGKSKIDMTGTALSLNDASVADLMQTLYDILNDYITKGMPVVFAPGGNLGAVWAPAVATNTTKWQQAIQEFKLKIK